MIKELTQTIQNKINIDKTLQVISILFVLYFLDEFYSVFSDTFNDRVEFSNSLNFFVKFFQNVIFGVLFLSLFLKFKYRDIGFVMPFAYMEQADNILANQVHPILVKSGFYNIFTDNPFLISPEYPRVALFFFILLASFLLLFTKWKNFKRIFLTLGAGGVFATSLIFHSIIIYEINFFKDHDSKTMQAISVLNKTYQEVEKSCLINNYDCYFYYQKDEDSLFYDNNIPEPIKKELPYLKPYLKDNTQFFWYGISHDSQSKNRLIGQTPFSISKNENFSLIIKNGGSYKDFFVINQYVFAWLTIASHTTWFLGSLFLIFFHERRFRKHSIKPNKS